MAGFSADPDPVKKEYNGKPISVFLVTFDFVQMFYVKEKDFKLKFVVYRENNYGMQRYELLDPNVKKKAKRNRYMKHRRLQGSRKIYNDKMRD